MNHELSQPLSTPEQPNRSFVRRALGMRASKQALQEYARLQAEVVAEHERRRVNAEKALAFLASVPDIQKLTNDIVSQTPVPEGFIDPDELDQDELDSRDYGGAWGPPSEREAKIQAGLPKLEEIIRSDSTPNIIGHKSYNPLGSTEELCSYGDAYIDKQASFRITAWGDSRDIAGIEYDYDGLDPTPSLQFTAQPQGEIRNLTLSEGDIHRITYHPSLPESQQRAHDVLDIQNFLSSRPVID